MQEPTKAYVLVQTDPRTDRIAERVRAVPGVLFAQDVRGPYDALALAGPDRAGSALEAILDEIRELPGVIRALAAPLS
ncbi:MAG: Lrp/AsnC ligand binding domain-containing protein, partial [Actinomycetota bacterium]